MQETIFFRSWLRQWRELQTYGAERSASLGLQVSDVERFIDEVRCVGDSPPRRP